MSADIRPPSETMPPLRIANSNGAGPAASPIDEEQFWSSRKTLEHLRSFARARMCSPWAVLGVTLARIIADTPPRITLPPIVGGRASLNIAIGLVGRPGAGKGAAEAAAREAILLPRTFKTHKLGSGQGLAHGYVRWEKDGKGSALVQHTEACLFVMQEVDHMVGLVGQRGSTLLPELRSALMGEQLGHLYVDPAKRLEVAPHTYRLALTVGIQPARAGVIFNDADGGTPQRFVWMPTGDPDAPEDPGKEPMPVNWRPPEWPLDSVLPVCAVAKEAIMAARHDELRGIGSELDGHRLLLREKIAAALDLLNGEAEVSERAGTWPGRSWPCPTAPVPPAKRRFPSVSVRPTKPAAGSTASARCWWSRGAGGRGRDQAGLLKHPARTRGTRLAGSRRVAQGTNQHRPRVLRRGDRAAGGRGADRGRRGRAGHPLSPCLTAREGWRKVADGHPWVSSNQCRTSIWSQKCPRVSREPLPGVATATPPPFLHPSAGRR